MKLADFGLCTGLKKAHRTEYYRDLTPQDLHSFGMIIMTCFDAKFVMVVKTFHDKIIIKTKELDARSPSSIGQCPQAIQLTLCLPGVSPLTSKIVWR